VLKNEARYFSAGISTEDKDQKFKGDLTWFFNRKVRFYEDD